MGADQEPSTAIRAVRICLDTNVYDKVVGYNRQLLFSAQGKGLLGICGFRPVERGPPAVSAKKTEKRSALLDLLELLPEEGPGTPDRDASRGGDICSPRDAARVAAAQAAGCEYFVTESPALRRAMRAAGTHVRPCSYRDLVRLLGILLYERPPAYRYLTEEELEYLYPMTYRRSPDRLLRIHNQLPRVRGARREHGIPARDGEEFTLTVEHVDSDLIQGVHLATDAFLVLSGARYERSVTVLFGPETSTELEARPRSLRGSTTVPGDGGTEYRIECHTKEGTLWLWNVCAYDSQGVRMVRSGDMASGMLVEDLADGYRYRCNDIGNDDDYDDLVFRVERTGAAEPPPPPKEHSLSRRPR